MKLSWQKHRFHLKETFSISYGNYDYRDSLTVMLSHDGKTGFGECVSINYYHIDLEIFVAVLEKIKNAVLSFGIKHPKDFYNDLLQFNLHSFLLSALDCAYWDLYGKLNEKSFAELNHLDTSILPESSYTISIAPINEQIEKIMMSDWKKFKVKCKGLNREEIFKLFETGKGIALDSNTSFSDDDCVFLQNSGLSEGFLYIEQPRPIQEYKILDQNKFANWMADEDCQDITFLEPLRQHYAAINVKLMKCGGLTPALELIRKAKDVGYKIMIGCMTESSIGISAGIAIAPLCDFADLDGANLISNDHAVGSFVEKGKIFTSENPGLGIFLK